MIKMKIQLFGGRGAGGGGRMGGGGGVNPANIAYKRTRKFC